MYKILFVLLITMLINNIAISQNCGTTNVALNKPVTAIAAMSSPVAGVVSDGDIASDWYYLETQDNGVYLDLGQSYVACRVLIKWTIHKSAYDFKIQSSNTANANDWTDIATIGEFAQFAGGNAYQYHDVVLTSNSVTGRYIRLFIPNMPAWAVRVAEFEVFSSSNQLPAVTITAPQVDDHFAGGNNVIISANATDQDGTISKVEFYRGTTLLGQDLTAPFSYTWNNVANGSYAITAKAFDNNNGSSLSQPVNITVNPIAGVWVTSGNAGSNPATQFIGTTDNQPLIFKTNGQETMRVTTDGKILVNTTVSKGEFTVNGDIWAKKLSITQQNWPDYVFDSSYRLAPLSEVEAFIQKNKHLPDVPSVKQVEKEGISVGDNQAILLRKIEELTLHLISQDKKLQQQAVEIEKLKQQLKK